jgi:hypothetical protein
MLVVGFQGIGLWFQPGWANGWPGLSKHDVWAAGMTVLVWLLAVCGGAAVFVLIGGILQAAMRRDYAGWTAFALLMVAWLLICTNAVICRFSGVRATIAHEWP